MRERWTKGFADLDFPQEEFHFIDAKNNKQIQQPAARDINGDGVPDLIIAEHLNGRLGTEYRIISLAGTGLKTIFDDTFVAATNFTDLDHNSKYEIESADSYENWNACQADSAYPRIVLQWNGQKYTASAKRMKAAAPTQSQLQAMAKQISNQQDNTNRVQLLVSDTIALIYSGNAAAAKKLVTLAYPNDKTLECEDAEYKQLKNVDADQFWKILISKIQQTSSVLLTLKELNPGTFGAVPVPQMSKSSN